MLDSLLAVSRKATYSPFIYYFFVKSPVNLCFTLSTKAQNKTKKMLKAKKKLWSPLSKRLLQTRTISSTTCGFLRNQQQHLSNSQPHSPFPFFSYNNNNKKIQTSPSSGFSSHFLSFSGKSFCSAQSSEKTNLRCWNCNAEPQNAPFLVCESCTTIQPVDHSVDYFQIFGL